jgi:hypothetical protein
MSQFDVSVTDSSGQLVGLRLASDSNGQPLWKTSRLDPLQSTVQVGEASYSSYNPKFTGVYSQSNLTGGAGKKTQVASTEPDATRYYAAEWMDWTIEGQGQKGPAVTTLTAPANMGALTGYFELGGTPYLVGTRKIASYSAGALTERRDFGASNTHGTAAAYQKLSTEAANESSTGDTSTDTVSSSDGMIAQQFRTTSAGVVFLSSVDCKLIAAAADTIGDVRLRVCTDLDGKPNLSDVIGTASFLAKTISTTATVYRFRFEETDGIVPIAFNEPFWLVLDAIGATATNTIGWRRGGTDTYTRGSSATSTNAGSTWTVSGSQDYYFTVYVKTATATTFVGSNTSGQAYSTSTDGATYTADPTFARESALFVLCGDTLVRDLRGKGAITWSLDGTNWSEPLPVGDVTSAVTALVPLPNVLIVCKTDSIWAVDILGDQSIEPIEQAFPVSTNGLGASDWYGTAYVPFNGRLVAIAGDFDNGFDVSRSVGPDAMPDWDFPHGAGRVVAVVGDRFYLYAILSATGGHRLYKSSDPLKLKWHGSIATIGDGTQSITCAFVYEPGGTGSPHMFCTTTANNIADIVLSRVPNPAADPNYLYDISATGDTYFPDASGLFWVNPKAWLTESVTFRQSRSADYVDMLYDDLDGDGWRRIEDSGGRMYDTGVLRYPQGLSSRLLRRRMQLTNTSTSQSPLILAAGVTYAVRPLTGVPLRNIEFTVLAEDGLSAQTLGQDLGIQAGTMVNLLDSAVYGGGNGSVVGPFGTTYDGVLFLDAEDTLLDLPNSDHNGLRGIKIVAAQVN